MLTSVFFPPPSSLFVFFLTFLHLPFIAQRLIVVVIVATIVIVGGGLILQPLPAAQFLVGEPERRPLRRLVIVGKDGVLEGFLDGQAEGAHYYSRGEYFGSFS